MTQIWNKTSNIKTKLAKLKKITTFWEIKYNLTLKFNVQHDKKESQFFFFSGKDKTKILSVRETEKKIASKIKKKNTWLTATSKVSLYKFRDIIKYTKHTLILILVE